MAIVRICRSMLGSIRRLETELLKAPPKKILNLNIQLFPWKESPFCRGKLWGSILVIGSVPFWGFPRTWALIAGTSHWFICGHGGHLSRDPSMRKRSFHCLLDGRRRLWWGQLCPWNLSDLSVKKPLPKVSTSRGFIAIINPYFYP